VTAPIPISAPFDVSNPPAQFFGQPMPANSAVVYRPGYVRGAPGTQAGNLYGTWAEALAAAKSLDLVQTTGGGTPVTILFDATDPANPSGPGICAIPAGTYTTVSTNTLWRLGLGTTTIALAAGALFPIDWMPILDGGADVLGTAVVSAGGPTPFRLHDSVLVVLQNGINLGDGTNAVIDVTSSGVMHLYGDNNVVLANGSLTSSDASATAFLFLTNNSEGQTPTSGFATVEPFIDASSVWSGSPAASLLDVASSVACTGPLGAVTVQQALDLLQAGTTALQFVVRDGYTGGEPGTYDGWVAALAAANSIVTVTTGGPQVTFVFDGTDPANPDPGHCHIPTGTYATVPPNTLWTSAPGTTQVILDSGAQFAPQFSPRLFYSTTGAGPLFTSAGGGAPFAITASNPAIAFFGVGIGDGTNPVFDIRDGASFGFVAILSDFANSALSSSDTTGIAGGTLLLESSTQPNTFVGFASVFVEPDSTSVWQGVPFTSTNIGLLSVAAATSFNGSPTGPIFSVDVQDAVQEEVAPIVTFLPYAGSFPSPQYGRYGLLWSDLKALTSAAVGAPQTVFVDYQGITNSFTIPTAFPTSFPTAMIFVGVNDGSIGYPQIDLGTDGFTFVAELLLENITFTTGAGAAVAETTGGPAIVYLRGASHLGATGNFAVDFGTSPAPSLYLYDESALASGAFGTTSPGSGALTVVLTGASSIAAAAFDPTQFSPVFLTVESGNPFVDVTFLSLTTVNVGATVVTNGDPNTNGLTAQGAGAYCFNQATLQLFECTSDGLTWAIAPSQSGTGTLVNGVSAAIPAYLSASARIVVTRKDVAASTALGELVVPSASRTAGAPTSGGQFVVRSVIPATPGVDQAGDQSSFDWMVAP
jgi:hypothetical protein